MSSIEKIISWSELWRARRRRRTSLSYMVEDASLESADEVPFFFGGLPHTLRQRELAHFAIKFHNGSIRRGVGSKSPSSDFGYDFGRESERPEFV